MAKDRQIEYLPDGWVWRSAGQDGRTARHALDPHGNVVALRQAQNMQREERARLGSPKPPAQRRAGKIKTIRSTVGSGKRQINKTAKGGISLYAPSVKGRTETLVFYSLNDARNYVYQNRDSFPGWADFVIIQVRYTQRLVTTNKTGSDKVGQKNGYASITPFISVSSLLKFVDTNEDPEGEIRNPWNIAYDNIANYDMSGKNARVYIELEQYGRGV